MEAEDAWAGSRARAGVENVVELFRGNILAPMVRAGTLPLREQSLGFGADCVYGEELVDRSVLECRRVVSDDASRCDLVKEKSKLERPLFSVLRCHAARTVFQLGTNCAVNAVAAAQLVVDEVAGIDVNMGCPKEFSVKGGMGAELMRNHEAVVDILKSLRANLPAEKSVSCKIRLLPAVADTVAFCQMVERCGVTAIAVHGRTRDERDHHRANWAHVAAVKQAVRVPVVLNGDVFCYDDFARARRETGVDGVMTARAALANPSVFRAAGPVDVLQAAREYAALARRLENHFQNTKWVVLRMLAGVSRKEKEHKHVIQAVTNCRDYDGLEVALVAQAAAESETKRQRLSS